MISTRVLSMYIDVLCFFCPFPVADIIKPVFVLESDPDNTVKFGEPSVLPWLVGYQTNFKTAL